MKSANVLIVEDYPLMADLAKRNLEARGHRVVHTAGSVIAAVTFIDRVAAGDPDVPDVEIVLTDGNTENGHYDRADGEQVARHTHERLPGVVVIGWSVNGQVPGADYDVAKHDIGALAQLILDLPEPEARNT